VTEMAKTRYLPGNPQTSARVLFFGRSGCEFTQKALAHLLMIGFEVTFVESKNRGDTLPEEISSWDGEYILSFRSLLILSGGLIAKASIASINFHPAPVEYPGSACLNFALYDNAEDYGVTAHIMNEKVDNGTIIECRRFPIVPNDTVDSLLLRTHLKLLDLFFDVVTNLFFGGRRSLDLKIQLSSGEKWLGEARKIKDLENLQSIAVHATKEELEKVIRATYTKDYPPMVELHGYEFLLKSPKAKSSQELSASPQSPQV